MLEVSVQIKNYRDSMGLSQEELAEKVYVSRQTISNWETGKNYPDIHSLLLLSSLFDISLDQLIKGDFQMMKEEIKEIEIKKLNHCGMILGILMIAIIVSAIPLAVCLGRYALIPWSAIVGTAFFFAYKAEKMKKDNHIHTYKEIVAFTEGKRLDEFEKQQEKGKRPYQRFLMALASGVIALVVCMVEAWLLL